MSIASTIASEITFQKTVADILLSKLEAIDPDCILAGGAPRDWHFGRQATDLDIYLYVPTFITRQGFLKQLNAIGIKQEQVEEVLPQDTDWDSTNGEYSLNPDVRWVFNYVGAKVPTQLIAMRQHTNFCVVCKFPLTICQAWYKDGQVNILPQFAHTVANRAIVQVEDGYANSGKYLEKILSKFPEFTYYDTELEYCQKYGLRDSLVYCNLLIPDEDDDEDIPF